MSKGLSASKLAAGIIVPAALACLCGCLATEDHVDDLRRQMNALNSSLGVMQKNQAELNSKMDDLSQNLAEHSENLKDFDRELSKVSAKLDDIESMFGDKMTDLSKSLKAQQAVDNRMVADANSRADATEKAMLPSKIYSDSYALLLKKSYERAIQGFELYNEKFPNGELVESAYYYMGDAYWSLGKWQESAVAYATLLERYKSSQFVPAARLRYAQCLLKLGTNRKEAIEYLQSVVRDFPDSPQAKLAQDQLTAISGAIPAAKPKRSKWHKKTTAAAKTAADAAQPAASAGAAQ
jgi:tol-pal system protein YbgF